MSKAAANERRNPEQKILVIKLGALGDFIQALGPMQAIRRHHPDAEITLMTTKPFMKLAEASPYFNHIWLDQKPKWHDMKGWTRLRKKLNKSNFARVYDLQNNDRTAFYLHLFRRSIRPEWIGVARGASHRNNSPERTKGKAFEGHRQTLALAGINHVEIDDMRWIKADNKGFNLKKPYVLLVPGSAPNRPEKRWPAANYATLAKALRAKGYQPVLLGTEAERDVTGEIISIFPEALDLTGQTSLFDIVVLARNAAAAIGNDTGPMHMIAPTGCPSWILFSKHSNPIHHAPLGPVLKTIQRDDLQKLTATELEDELDFNRFRTCLNNDAD